MAVYVQPGCCRGGVAAVFPDDQYQLLDEKNQQLVRNADSNDVESCFHVGKNLIEGENGFPVMLNLGESYLLKAVKKDHVESLIFYGLQLSKGDKLPKDDKKSQKYFQKAAKKGSSEAHVRIGQYLVDSAMSDNTKGNKNNILKKAAKEFQIAVKQNNSEAMMELADLYLNGKGVEKSDNEAVNLYKSASENGYPEGINAYAECLRNGKGCEKNVAESARLYKVNADKGDAKALFIYAQMCENGEGVNKEEKEASKYYRNAATAGNVDAVFRVSQLLLEGNDEFEQNQNEALEMLEKAAEMGHPKAMYEYSMRLYHGNGIPKNIEKAIDLCKKSAIKGDLNAEFFYGVILQESEEYDQSFSYLHSAANKGHVDAKIRIAYMRLYGCGAKIDFKEAFELFQANENDQRAIFGQAIMYEQGYFVEQNYSTAISKYREAASKGFVDGIAAESNLLRNGFGFESKDAKAADEMLQNSIENGSILGKLYYAINILNIFIHNSGKKKKSENEVPIREAIQIFTDISEKNKDKLAREKLAFCNLHGIGVPVNVERAIYLYKMSAKQGNRDALYELGMMLHQGKNIPQNKEEGIFNLKKSAKLNNLDAHAYYGWYLLKGDGCNKNVKKACKHTEIAAYHENVPGMAFFGIILYNGLGVQRDVNSAVPYIVKASEAGRADAMDVHGQMLEKGKGLQPNIVQAFHLYQKSAELHNVDGSFHYAQCLEHGRGCQVDFQKAIQFYKFAADSGHVESMYLYALFHDDIDRSKGEIAQNFGESAKYYLMAANAGHVDAMANYAVLLQEGKGVKKNLKEALKWNKQSAALGNTKAMNNAANQLLKGEGCFKKPKEAVKYLEKSAEKGDPIGLLMLGVVYEKGEGVEQSFIKAASFYKESARKQNEEAMFRVAGYLIEGKHIDKDTVLAYKYYKELADKDHLPSCVKIGLHYEEKGEYDNSVHYYQKASDGNNIEGYYNYGRLLIEGKGAEKNESNGVSLIKKAADSKYGKACTRYGTILQSGSFGVKKNEKAALKMFIHGYETGDDAAYHHYASALENGIGCKKDLKKAISFYEKSSKTKSQYASDDEKNYFRHILCLSHDLPL